MRITQLEQIYGTPVVVRYVTPGGACYGVTCYTAGAVLYAVGRANPADTVLIRPVR